MKSPVRSAESLALLPELSGLLASVVPLVGLLEPWEIGPVEAESQFAGGVVFGVGCLSGGVDNVACVRE